VAANNLNLLQYWLQSRVIQHSVLLVDKVFKTPQVIVSHYNYFLISYCCYAFSVMATVLVGR